jgi:hypothetical protein
LGCHEREDVVKWQKEYLKELANFEILSTQFVEDSKTKEWVIIPLTLDEDEQEHVLIWHDEMAVHANDCAKAYWGRADETVLCSKSQGRLMMVSDFIMAATENGRLTMTDKQWAEQLKLPEAERLPRNARKIIYPSTAPGGDNYWNMKQMIKQVRNRTHCNDHCLMAAASDSTATC